MMLDCLFSSFLYWSFLDWEAGAGEQFCGDKQLWGVHCGSGALVYWQVSQSQHSTWATDQSEGIIWPSAFLMYHPLPPERTFKHVFNLKLDPPPKNDIIWTNYKFLLYLYLNESIPVLFFFYLTLGLAGLGLGLVNFPIFCLYTYSCQSQVVCAWDSRTSQINDMVFYFRAHWRFRESPSPFLYN